MVFRPDAGRSLPHEKLRLLRALASKRGQIVETRRRLLAQIKAHGKLGSSEVFADMDADVKDLLDRQIAELVAQIEQIIAADESLAETSEILRSVPGIGPVASTMLVAVPLVTFPLEMHCRSMNAGTWAHIRRTGRSSHRPCSYRARQRCPSRETCHWRRQNAIAPRPIPGRTRCQPPQSGSQALRGSPACRRKATQSCHHRCRSETRDNR
ncbi:hypothetical protein TRL7639_01794 [Falsiruegeria litorea R37]|uniref:Transposase IS116/IS110/IS902 family protein n=1 Tax=Falsiruegeria litorea R37 TaxID=1200284 RepID=A0A1Y5SBS7_9RHOB|nr:hypothetical protein TRL7639_01794 [Falsiruegeria litorea R37]